MSFLRSNAGAANAQQNWVPLYGGLQIQTSTNGVPIAILYGTNKISFNMIWSGGFFASPNYASSGSRGKGGGGGQSVSSYNYSTALALGLCEGPIASISTVYENSSVGTPGDLNFNFFNGSTPQAPWSFLSTHYPNEALSYNGLAYVAAPLFFLGTSPQLPTLEYEVHGVLSAPATSAVVNGFDADPALIIQDFLTNAQYGVGFPAGSINASTLLGSSGDSSYQIYCRAQGLALSPALINQETASSIMTRWLQLTNTAVIWSGGELKFIPYGDDSVTMTHSAPPDGDGATVTFNPNVTPVYNLTDHDYVHDGDNDPVQITRSDPFTAKNWLSVEIQQRSLTSFNSVLSYQAVPIEVWDQNAIEQFGVRKASTITAHEICDPAVGQTAAQLILQRGLYIRNIYQFKLSFEYCLLEPMDLVALTDSVLGLDAAVVRVTAIEEDDAGVLSVTAEEFPQGIASSVAYPVQPASPTFYTSSVISDPVNAPIIFEPGPDLTDGVAQVWMAVSGGASGVADPNWGGAIINISLDNITYSQIGQVTLPARQGVLSAALATLSGDNPDATHTLSVNLAESAGTLESVSATDAQNAVTLSVVDQELISYATATLTGANAYNLTYLERGLYGTTPAAHSSGAPFARLDNAIFKYNLPTGFIGQTIYVKLQSFNIFGQAIQDISACAVYTYTPTGVGAEGPVASALAIGANLDYGLAGASVDESDDFGLASDASTIVIDLGLASA